MNILIGSNVHWWNAEAAYAAVTAEMLRKAGHRVFVLTRPGSENRNRLSALGLSLVTDFDLNSANPFRLLASFIRLLRFLRREKIDLVNAHRSEGFPLYVFAKMVQPTFRLIRTRGAARSVKNHWLNRRLHRDWIDGMIVPGKVVFDRFLRGMPLSPDRLRVIHYPVDLPEWPLPVPHQTYRREFAIPPKNLVLAVVGRIRPEKGQRLLLRSLKRLLVDFPDTTLLVIYRDTTSREPEFQALMDEMKALDLAPNIRLIGEREDIRTLMGFADAGIVSSVDSEVICRVAVEFFSAGTPVTAMPTGCLPEIIREGENGTLASEKTVEALYCAMMRLIEDTGLLKEMGRNARRDAETRFNPERMKQQTVDFFLQVLNSKTIR